VNVNWTVAAQKHLVDIYEYIATDSDLYAQRMIDRLTLRSEQIGNFPMSGRMVPEYDLPDIREVIFREAT
jgi:plasmid stabilization system protein ParE